MIGSMQSPWQADLSLQTGDEDYLVETNDRGWMGNMIERSTSAPPISTATKLNFMNVLGSEPAGPNVRTGVRFALCLFSSFSLQIPY
jgi:hypothetical protein